MAENLHKGHRQRVRNRFLKSGNLEDFEEHQILELLLFYALPMKDTNELAHKMLNEFGSLYNLCRAKPAEVAKKCKVTENTAVLVSLIPHIAHAIERSKWKTKIALETSLKLGEFTTTLFHDKRVECFYVICLDYRMRLKGAMKVSEGNVFSAPVYTRDIVAAALHYDAIFVVLAHNHLNGTLSPSQDDIDTTITLAASLDLLEIDVLDHIIVCDGQYYSLKQHGHFQPAR